MTIVFNNVNSKVGLKLKEGGLFKMIKEARIVSVQTDPEDYFNYKPGPRGSIDRVMSRSDLMEFFHCPARWVRGYEKKETSAKDYGSMIDSYILDNEAFENKHTVRPKEYYSEKDDVDKPWNMNAKFCKDWMALQGDKIVIAEDDIDKCEAALKSAERDSIVNYILENSKKQVMITGMWVDKSGICVPLKSLLDIVPERDSDYGQYLGDFKTCRSAAVAKWPREIWQYGYHIQAAFYGDMHYAATGETRDGFVHILQESYEPYEVGRRLLSEEFIELGRGIYQSALSKYCECLKSGIWTGYDDDESKSIDGFTITEPEAWMVK